MKKLLRVLPLFILGSLQAQTNCNAGYESPTFANTLNTPSNTIFTISVTASSAGTLTGVSFYDAGMSSANIKCCVYDDAAGHPGNLIASTSTYQLTNTPGPVTLTVTPVFIPAGTYHVGAVIDMNASAIPIDNSTTVTLYAYPSPFANPFPASGSSFVTTNGNPVNIWMNITCSATGMNEPAGGDLSFKSFPSPVTDNLTLQFTSEHDRTVVLELYNNSGELVSESALILSAGENSQMISMEDLSSGIYLVRVNNESGECLVSRRIIKE